MIKEIKMILTTGGELRQPGDMLTITAEDLQSYRKVEAFLSFLDEEFHSLRKTASEVE